MCGITGAYNLNKEPVALHVIKAMTNQIAHRGRDGEGFFVEANIGLGHKRLAILDVSDKGAQPMHSKDGNWVVVFNGCIYNYLELKVELKSLGHNFISTSDTEVIILCENE